MATEFYPTMFRAWGIVAQKLIPVFQALGEAYTSRVLPVQRQVLAQLKQYGPIIGPVVSQIVKMIAALAVLGATIAGRTLPPAIRFAGVMSGPVFSALLAAMSASNRAETAIGQFARQMVQAIGSAQRFQAGVISAIGKAINAVEEIPGKARAALGDLTNTLYSYGRNLILGFINGIKDKAGEIVGAVTGPISSAISGVKGLLHIGSPSKLFHQIGKWTMEGFENGINEAGPKVLKAMQSALEKTLSQLDTFRSGVQSRLDSVMSAFSSLKDSIASTFTGDLFNVSAIASSLTDTTFTAAQTVGQAFTNGLLDTRGRLKELLAAFRKLKGWGIPAQFLSQMFASGNSGLILELASGTRAQAQSDAALFGDVQSLSNQLGSNVARNQYGEQINSLDAKLARIVKHTAYLEHLDKRLARALNDSASKAQRSPA